MIGNRLAMLTLTRNRRRVTPIGLDVSPRAIRAVQLDRSRGTAGERWTVACLVSQPNAQMSAPVAEDPEALTVAECIRNCIERGDFTGRSVVSVLAPPDIEIHALELPNLAGQPREQVKDIVHWEIKRLATSQMDDVQSAYWPLPAASGRTPDAVGIAAPTPLVTSLAQSCSDAGLECSVIDALPCALARGGWALADRGPSDVWGVLDLGARQSRLIVCLGETPVLARSAGGGGEDWTRRVGDALKLSEESAEIHKCDHGIAPSGRGVRSGVTPRGCRHELAAILFGALRATLGKLILEVERSYAYVLGCYPDARARDLVLVGGGAAMPRLSEHLAGHLGIKVRRASEYLGERECRLDVGVKMKEPFERFVTAIGLAMEATPP